MARCAAKNRFARRCNALASLAQKRVELRAAEHQDQHNRLSALLQNRPSFFG